MTPSPGAYALKVSPNEVDDLISVFCEKTEKDTMHKIMLKKIFFI